MSRLLRPTLFVIGLLALTVSARSQDVPSKPGRGDRADRADRADKADASASKAPEPKDNVVDTNHTITLAGRPLHYLASAGTLVLRDDGGKPTASIFFVAYNKVEGANSRTPDPARPVTFCFNGGPGSSAVWLHLGAFGPRVVQLPDTAEPPHPPYTFVDNEFTLLDLTDLVFIDPVSTGYSRAAPGVDPKKFHGVQEDVQSVGDFIRLYTSRYNRWRSPKYVAGESYGTTRAAGLAGYLQDRQGMYLNGVVLVSSVLNFQTIRFDEGNDLPFALFLPTYTATAWYHKRLPPELQSGSLADVAAEAERFALNEYTVALGAGDKLAEAQKQDVARKVARFTGLSEDFVRRANLRIEIQRFCKELLRDQGKTVGRYDSRLTGGDLDAAGERPEYDPSYTSVQGAFTAVMNQYLRDELHAQNNDLTYEILTGRVQPWDYGTARNRYLNVAPTLRAAMTKNRDLKLFVASGYYDLATPFAAANYTLAHLGLDPSQRPRVTAAYYEAGHMMYTHRPSHEKLRRDLAAFLRGDRPAEAAGGGR